MNYSCCSIQKILDLSANPLTAIHIQFKFFTIYLHISSLSAALYIKVTNQFFKAFVPSSLWNLKSYLLTPNFCWHNPSWKFSITYFNNGHSNYDSHLLTSRQSWDEHEVTYSISLDIWNYDTLFILQKKYLEIILTTEKHIACWDCYSKFKVESPNIGL